ncbi:hypothetical protein [Xanthobacter tagetidis]|uniref:Uncharacterized protein n=1 Tax=Xanthobacter tagetidis TaxID=60216 RepID=A0A3L7AIJ5_9HYPH|nr:hypothetical protein [Xanthobacter tagetidis]MBB6306265.1 hypothetical protein [Xanthobacter tagetidis]RLP79540.1 hypothetical protein D9R14_07710 [Xanthobacter tagetidis]
MADLLDFILKSRRARRHPRPVPEPPQAVPSPPAASAARQPCEVVSLSDRRAALCPFPPLPPYICGFMLGAALVTTAAASLTAAAWAAQVRASAEILESWSV